MWSEPVIEAIESELLNYAEADVLHALTRCARELRTPMKLTDILDRIPNQHPGVEEAWAMIAPKVKSDAPTVFVTDPMREAYGAALAIKDDLIAARMAFKEVYQQAVSRAPRGKPHWSMIPGTDRNAKELAITEAVKKGIAQPEWAMQQLPVEVHESVRQLAGNVNVKRLA
jgi:hypothetical protein